MSSKFLKNIESDNIANAIDLVWWNETSNTTTDNPTDFKFKVRLKKDNTIIAESNILDLPLEELIVSGTYNASYTDGNNNTYKAIVLTLKNGNVIPIPVTDMVNGLVSKVVNTNTFNGVLKSGYNYNLSSAISSLTVSSVEDGDLESNVFFTVSGSSFNPSLPNGVKVIGTKPTFENGARYVMSYYNSTVVFGKLNNL